MYYILLLLSIMFNIDIISNPFNELVSPFHPVFQTQTSKYKPLTRQLCNCDDDAGEMAPECAFLCINNNVVVHKSHDSTKKRRSNRHDAKKTRRK